MAKLLASFSDPMQSVILYTATPLFFRFTITRIGSATGKSSTRHASPKTRTRQELVRHLNVGRRLGNVGQGVDRNTNRLHHRRLLLLRIIRHVVISFLGLLNVSIQNVVDILLVRIGSSIHGRLLSIRGYSLTELRNSLRVGQNKDMHSSQTENEEEEKR